MSDESSDPDLTEERHDLEDDLNAYDLFSDLQVDNIITL